MEGTLYRKKPIEVYAMQYTGPDTDGGVDALTRFGARVEPAGEWGSNHTLRVWVSIEDQWVDLRVGDWLICGVNGEFYPCAVETFDITYEPVVRGVEVAPEPAQATGDIVVMDAEMAESVEDEG